MSSRWEKMRLILIAAAPIVLAACGARGEPCPDEDCPSITLAVREPCESFGCGGNAQVSGYYFHELHAGGLPNGQGIAVDGFFSGEGAAHRIPVGTPMVLDVQGDRLMGLVDGHPSIEGTELVGATIGLWFPGTPNSAIKIKQVYETEFWVSAADGPEH